MNGQIQEDLELEGTLTLNLELTGNIYSDDLTGELTLGNQTTTAYSGSYTITPSSESQTINTTDKIMLSNIQINGIPYEEVPNEYGNTVYIG